jgi:hypothetical protein
MTKAKTIAIGFSATLAASIGFYFIISWAFTPREPNIVFPMYPIGDRPMCSKDGTHWFYARDGVCYAADAP